MKFRCAPRQPAIDRDGSHVLGAAPAHGGGLVFAFGRQQRRPAVPPVRAEDGTQRRNWIRAIALAPSPRKECEDGSDGELTPSSSAACLVSLSPQAGRDVCARGLRYRGEQYLPQSPSPRQVTSLYGDCQQAENRVYLTRNGELNLLCRWSLQSSLEVAGFWPSTAPARPTPSPAGGCSLPRCPTAALAARARLHPAVSPPLPQPALLQLLNCLPAALPLIYATSALSWIIILYEMFVLYPPPVLKCQEYIPRPSIFNTSAWAWQFSDMNIMALNAESPSLKLTSVRISSLQQGR